MLRLSNHMTPLLAACKSQSAPGRSNRLLGGLLSICNFFFMAVGASLAADRAEQQNVKGGTALVRMSFLLRYLVLFLILFAAAKSKRFDLLALVLPLVFVRPILMLGEFFRKSGEKRS